MSKHTQLAAFDDVPRDGKAKNLTASARQLRAIKNFCDKGYRPELSHHPVYHFANKFTGLHVTVHIAELEAQYDMDRRSAARERAEERRRSKS